MTVEREPEQVAFSWSIKSRTLSVREWKWVLILLVREKQKGFCLILLVREKENIFYFESAVLTTVRKMRLMTKEETNLLAFLLTVYIYNKYWLWQNIWAFKCTYWKTSLQLNIIPMMHENCVIIILVQLHF